MNQWKLNGQLLGEGVTDPRIFLSVNIPVKVSTTATSYARRYLGANIGVKVGVSAPLTGVFRLASAINVKAKLVTGTIGTYYAKYLTAAINVNVGLSTNPYAIRSLASAINVKVASAFDVFRGRTLAAGIPVKVTMDAAISELAFPASEERTMIIPADDRKMKVT